MNVHRLPCAVSRGLRLLVAALPLLGPLLVGGPASAQSTLGVSPDITIALGPGGLVVQDEDVVVDNQLGVVLLEDLGPLPGAAEVVGHAIAANGDRLFVLANTTSLAGGVTAAGGDVVRYDGVAFSIELDASSVGIPRGVLIDAVSIAPTGLLVSFDTTVALSGGLVAADEDLVRWDGADFTAALDASSAGVATTLDVDAAQDLGGGTFLVSFDTSGSVGGVSFDDEDVLRYDGASWTLEIDASSLDADWRAADLDALQVPEPGTAIALAFGAGALARLARRRAAR